MIGKKIIKNILTLWFVGILISVYIIASNVFPDIRISYSIWNETTTEIFNGVMTSLAVSYLTGMIVYGLTVVHKNNKERRKRRWELDALVTALNRVLEPLEETIGRFDRTDAKSLRKIKDDTFNTFIDNIVKTLDGVHFCKDIMNEEEYEKISDIRRALSVLINPPSAMDDDEVEWCLQALRDIRADIDFIQKSVYLLMWQKTKSEP